MDRASGKGLPMRQSVLPEPEKLGETATGAADDRRLDQSVLARLAADLHSTAAVTRICERFLDLLPARLERLRSSMAAGQQDVALDVTLSLAVTAATLGGTALHAAMRELERRLGRHDLASAEALLPLVEQAATAFASALREAVLLMASAVPPTQPRGAQPGA